MDKTLKNELIAKYPSCETHCCALHGCKYGYIDCPVENKVVSQSYRCEYCPTIETYNLIVSQLEECARELDFLKERGL